MIDEYEIEEDDYISYDGVSWYQSGKLIFKADPPDDIEARLSWHALLNNYWPNAWMISDHGNSIPFRYVLESPK